MGTGALTPSGSGRSMKLITQVNGVPKLTRPPPPLRAYMSSARQLHFLKRQHLLEPIGVRL